MSTLPPLAVTHRYDTGDTLERFNGDIENHRMTILHDDGLYRHVRFKAPDTGMYWFDLHTSPGLLTIDGDMGTHSFRRIPDMFQFFTGTYVNVGYWAEKVVSSRRDDHKEFSSDNFKQHIYEHFWQTSRYMEPDDAKKWWDVLVDDIFGKHRYLPGTYEEASNALEDVDRQLGSEHYDDLWDWGGFREYEFGFLWCLHAILWGIQQYKTEKASSDA